MYWDGAEWWAWIPMSLMMVAFWAFVVWAVVEIVGGRRARRAPPSPPATEILDQRLARGEIDVVEYLERRATLEGRSGDREEVGEG